MSSSVAGIASLLRAKASTERERQLMKELFAIADQNRDGFLDFEEYSKVFTNKGLKMSPDDIKRVFEFNDKNRDNKLSPLELWDHEDDDEVRDRASAALRAYDRDGDGYVSKLEMATVSGSKLSPSQINHCFKMNDLDGDGLLNQRELEGMFRKAKMKKRRSKAAE